jgi:transformer-2 protein
MIGNLAWHVTSDDLEEEFSRFGPLKDATIWIDLKTGESYGFGFVTFEKQDDAELAATRLNRKKRWGERITVKYAQIKS